MTDFQPEKSTTNGVAKALPHWRMTPDVDVYESDVAFLIQLDVPGAKATSISVQVIGTRVHVRAEQARIEQAHDVPLAVFEREVDLPGEVDPTSAAAQLANGVLEIRIAKSAAARRIEIPVRIN